MTAAVSSSQSVIPAYAPARVGDPKAVWVLLGANLVLRALGFAYPFMSFHVAAQGHGPETVGLVLVVFGVGWIVGQLVCGRLVDRVGVRTTLTITMTLAAVTLALLAAAHRVPALVAGAALAGLVYDALRPVLSSVIGNQITDPRRRAKLEAWRFGSVANLGSAISFGLGGLLGARLGIEMLFRINAAACLAVAVAAVLVIPSACSSSPADRGPGMRQAFADRRFAWVIGCSVLSVTAFMGLYVSMPLLMAARGLPVSSYGGAAMGNAVTVVLVTPFMAPWLGRQLSGQPRVDLMMFAGLWMTACMASTGFAGSTVQFGLAAVALGVGETVWFVIVADVIHRIAPAGQRGWYQGIWGSTFALAAVISPALAAWSLAHGGPHIVAVTTLGVGALGALLCLPLRGLLADLASTTGPASGGATK